MEKHTVDAYIPLQEVVGEYSNTLRSLTHGSGIFSMELKAYGKVSQQALRRGRKEAEAEDEGPDVLDAGADEKDGDTPRQRAST
jgi:translation elongation factor EF-G